MLLMVPLDLTAYPTLGPQVCDFIEQNMVFGPGDLRGKPLVLDDERRALIYRMYEVQPKGHLKAGRRRFKRAALSLPKGLGKTELSAIITACELHPEAPVRCVGWTKGGEPIGGPVTDPYIPMVAFSQAQSDELAFSALRVMLEHSHLKDDFDIGLERILRRRGDGRAEALSSNPNSRDGARTTFAVLDEPLAVDTPVPTTQGWRTMGDLVEGDYVFDRHGQSVRVLGGSPVHEGRPCFRLTFADGDSIVADENHRWKAVEWSGSKIERVVTTRMMFEAGTETGYGKRWRLPRAAGFDCVEAALPVDPYVLGLWLGDGDARNATISVGEQDLFETRRHIEACGYVVTQCKARERTPLLYVTRRDSAMTGWAVVNGGVSSARSLVGDLRELDVLENKHVPQEYMFASRAQRIALLQGLMDSDGHCMPGGTCTFVQKRRDLAEQVCDLARSLGVNARLHEQVEPRSRTGFMYKVHFTPKFCAFRLFRKAARCQQTELTAERWPTVISIEPCESVPVRCIAVDSDDHLFIVGRGLRLTHNTHRWTLPRQRQAHTVMQTNLPKRKIADGWMLEVTTAPEPGAGSVAESTMDYARAVQAGKVKDSTLFFFHRQAGDEHDLTTREGRIDALIEASGAAASWRDIDGIESLWNDPGADTTYLERVYTNRLVQHGTQAFNVEQWKALANEPMHVRKDQLITLGFDGAQFHDSTALVATDVASGYQWIVDLWECPPGKTDWKVPAVEVDKVVRETFERYTVWRLYADPPYWQSWIAKWQAEFGEDRVVEWLTTRTKAMASALEGFDTAIKERSISHCGDERLKRHIGNSRRKNLLQRDEQGKALWLIQKERPDSPHKIDAAMAAVLSWEARTDAIAAGALKPAPKVGLFFLGGRA